MTAEVTPSPPEWPDRIPLLYGSTPLTRPHRTARALDIDLWVKRDDMTGVAESGNKIRKLEYLVAEAKAQAADTLITCGGVNSNHARATAIVAARLGLRAQLVLRGKDRRPLTGNLLLNRFVGASVDFVSAFQWADRYAIMDDVAARLRTRGRKPYIIPEGGSNALGSIGYARMIPELLQQVAAVNGRLRRVVHATGSGGTTAGLAWGLALAGRPDVDVLAVAVCNDATYFDDRVETLLNDAVTRGWLTKDVRQRARWTHVDGYKGRGYGRTTREEMASHADLARSDGLFVDPVYSGKAFVGLRAEAKNGDWSDGTTVFLHTGGLFELFAFPQEVEALDDAPEPL